LHIMMFIYYNNPLRFVQVYLLELKILLFMFKFILKLITVIIILIIYFI
jgi:hypothetical protein